jgi:hypothetical protein
MQVFFEKNKFSENSENSEFLFSKNSQESVKFLLSQAKKLFENI